MDRGGARRRREILAGGERRDGLIKPTVLADVADDAKVICDEVFGPVVHRQPRRLDRRGDRARERRRASASRPGSSPRSTRALDAADRLEFGGVIVNEAPTFRSDQMPYGGVKARATRRRPGLGRARADRGAPRRRSSSDAAVSRLGSTLGADARSARSPAGSAALPAADPAAPSAGRCRPPGSSAASGAPSCSSARSALRDLGGLMLEMYRRDQFRAGPARRPLRRARGARGAARRARRAPRRRRLARPPRRSARCELRRARLLGLEVLRAVRTRRWRRRRAAGRAP